MTADLPIRPDTFDTVYDRFEVAEPGPDIIRIHHHFTIPDSNRSPGKNVYDVPPWSVYRDGDSWRYLGVTPDDRNNYHRVAVFNDAHTVGEIYSPSDEEFRRGRIHSLSLMPSDQIFIARALADREACYFHSGGMVIDGRGLLLVGHSEAGKSTTVMALQEMGDILCDDRNIVRRWPGGFQLHGTWSHGDVSEVSSASAPLAAILFIEKADTNEIVPIGGPKEVIRLLPFFVIKPLVTADWWEKTLDLLEMIAREVPVYRLRLDRSGKVRDVVRDFLGELT